MAADWGTALSLLLTGPQPAAVLLWLAVYLVPSLAIAVALRRPGLDGFAFGLLVLTAAADLAMFVLRGEGGAVGWHLPLTAALALALTLVLRRWALPAASRRRGLDAAEWGLLALTAALFWAVRIVQVDPSSGLSSQLGWAPLSMAESFRAGRFLLQGDFHFGVGPADSLFYAVDMLGLVALAGDLGAAHFYPAYLATSILAVGIAVLLPLAALRGRPAAQLVYVALLAAIVVVDPQAQAAIARHWGDNVLILGGSLIMTILARRPAAREALLSAACAAAFLVLGRHYGAVFAALLMAALAAIAWVVHGRRALAWWPAWLAAGLLLCVLSLRDVLYLLHPEPYYPGGKLLALVGSGWRYHVEGALHDWGFMTAGRWTPVGPRTLWLAGLVALLLADRGRRRRGHRLLVRLAPVAVMLAPLALELLTGYRSSGQTNKPYLLGVLFGAFYPAFAVAWLGGGRRCDEWGWRLRRLGLAGAAAAALLWTVAGPLLGMGPGRTLAWAKGLYDDHIVDLGIARALAADGVPPAVVADRPLMYFYCEPGMGLRNYIGGSLRHDLDFWGATVQDAMPAATSLAGLLASLGWPDLYFSSPATYADFVDGRWRRFEPELRDIEHQPWVERVVRFRDARLVIVKRP